MILCTGMFYHDSFVPDSIAKLNSIWYFLGYNTGFRKSAMVLNVDVMLITDIFSISRVATLRASAKILQE